MAELIFTAVGSAIGQGIGGTVGMIAGRLVGAAAGALVNSAFGGGSRTVEGPRLKDLDVMASTEGAPIPRVYGRMRIAGQVIWATELEESVSVSRSGGGGKGGRASTTTRTYSYFANLAVGICEGPIARIGRIWADGKEIDQSTVNLRLYQGHEGQMPDPLMVARDGASAVPAYRGLAYAVFERLALERYGNRVPQFAFEVVRPVGELEAMTRSVVMIPGATEFGYSPEVMTRLIEKGRAGPETRHSSLNGSDFITALDDLCLMCPRLERVALVVSWFGTDLRAGQCQVRPGVEIRDKTVSSDDWQVSGESRATAYLVSQYGGRPAYGGTPSDGSVIAAIQALKARGLKVSLLPFIMMDVPAGNSLPDPWSGAGSQPTYPWRGRITCDPAPGRAGSVDASPVAAAQVSAFVGSAQPSHFPDMGPDVIAYSGPDEWSYRRMVLHMASLARAAGGVDTFVVGSEMIGLTRVRSSAGAYPFVDALISLTNDVRSMLPGGTLTYAADWTEYGAHVIGSDIRFPLDPLWASPHIGAVGIDYYAPLADHRDGSGNSPYDVATLRAGLRSGEGYEWYYADESARLASARTPITDGLGKPWIHRQKDLAGWWSNFHVERVGGVEVQGTAWVPGMKPIWLTELGFPAVDKGANRPSVFPDPKSVESGVPPFSTGTRDDLIQRRALEAVLRAFDPEFGATAAENPVSPVYGGRMIDPAVIQLWCWDARPWPAFPRFRSVWADGDNWQTGHWLTGRYGAAPLADLARVLLAEHGIFNVDVSGLEGVVDGAVVDRPMSAREALEPLARGFGFEVIDRGQTIVMRSLSRRSAITLGVETCVVEKDNRPIAVTRRQESELPAELSLAFLETEADYRASAVIARRQTGASRRTSSLTAAVASDGVQMGRQAEATLHRLWAARDTAKFSLPLSMLAVEPGDLLTIQTSDASRLLRVTRLEGLGSREVEAESATTILAPPKREPSRFDAPAPRVIGAPAVVILDLPALSENDPQSLQYLAAASDPWTEMAVWRGDGDGYAVVANLTSPSLMGETLAPFARGPLYIYDRVNSLTVRLVTGALSSLPESRVLAGANAAAIRGPNGRYEIIQFVNATLVAERTYVLTTLLRGQRGTEDAMATVPPGSPVVFLDGPIASLGSSLDLVGRPVTYRVGPLTAEPTSTAVTSVATSAGLRALQPPSPVQLSARRGPDGIRFDWIRRGRLSFDSWDVAEIPLGESVEAYRITILDGVGAELRVAEVASPTWLYAAANEVADFGAPVTSLRVRVTQSSSIAGQGRLLEATLSP
ncbi:MAG: glycoside hydrolase/phage tail family protein [Alphaproteobacteria bacterium]